MWKIFRRNEAHYSSLSELLKKYGGNEWGFYNAFDLGHVKVGSEDYNRLYVPKRHACFLLSLITRRLETHRGLPKGIELSLARIEGLLAGR
ncbi:hypothetical protein LCGC14_1857690 [marine sediment metagenome]|uniref:Uncharacterized protein n=1 Tax=marine sediment metagenome TaxID=412755 RepID=A0A0F9G8D0_9ZZZZ